VAPVATIPTIVVKAAVTEITFVLSVEPLAIVLVVEAILEVAVPNGILIIGIAREIPFRNANACIYTNLGISAAGYQATGDNHGEDE
jgi:hypothetical protein